MSKKKFILFITTLVLLCAGFVATTLAFFTDALTFEDNVITVGTIDIELFESQYSKEDGKTDQELRDSAEGYQDFLATEGEDILPAVYTPKCPYIDNLGSNQAYVRIRVIALAEMDPYLALNWNEALCDVSGTDSSKEYGKPVRSTFTEDEVDYVCYTVTRTQPLAAGTLSGNALASVGLKPEVTSADIQDLHDKGILKIGEDSKFTVTIEADAIQTYGFDTVEKAFETFDGLSDDQKQ